MKNFLKKSVLLGVGFYSKAQKELEKTVKGLVKKNKITKKEGEEMVKEFLKNSKKTEARLEQEIKKNAHSFAKRVALAKQKDLLTLERRIKRLEAQLKPKTKKKAPVKRK